MMNHHGNTLVITLLALTVAAIVGLCLAPLQFLPCGHRCSLFDRMFPAWNGGHACHGHALQHDLHVIHRSVEAYRKEHGRLEEALFEMVPPNSLSDDYMWSGSYKFGYIKTGGDWRVTVAQTPGLPGWYLLTSDDQIHFSENGPATPKDRVLEESAAKRGK
jgi:hypothetical protein